MKDFKTVSISERPKHHSGIKMGFYVESTVLPNTRRSMSNEDEALKYAEYLEKVAMSMYQ